MNTTIDRAVENRILQLLPHLSIRSAHIVAGGENSEEEIRHHTQERLEASCDIVKPWLEASRSAAKRQ